MAASLPKLGTDARTITLRIVYSKTGEVNPAYNTPTLSNVERHATVTAKATDVASNRDKWQDADEKSVPSSWVVYKIIGKLPPR